MAKDPAFLFYYEDFFTGVSDLTNEEVGAYIRCLCIQASKGGISEKHMKNICITSDVFMNVISKFKIDEETKLYFNERLKFEKEKRSKYSESRSNNRRGKIKDKKHMKKISKSYVKHMENENVNENIDININEIETRKTEPKKLLFPFAGEKFLKTWGVLSTQPKWKKKTIEALQASLDQLSQYDEMTATQMMLKSIAGGWQGLFELDNKTKNGNGNNNEQSRKDKLIGALEIVRQREFERQNNT